MINDIIRYIPYTTIKKSLMLTKAAFIYSKYSKTLIIAILHFKYALKFN